MDPWDGLLERHDVTAAITQLVSHVAPDGAGALFIVGEAGLGKTSLVDRACRLASVAGLAVGTGRGHSMETGCRPVCCRRCWTRWAPAGCS